MNENLTKICRICLTEGSRNIFQKTVAHDALYNVSSLNRISEKLRYVTLLKIDEMENLPPMICDLCIVQLNVAYNFKRQATESDTKLRQYLIENGIDIMKDIRSLAPAIRAPNPPTPATATNTTRAIIQPPPVPPVTSSSVVSRTNNRISSTSSVSVVEVPAGGGVVPVNGQSTFEPRLVPIRIKVETPETVEQSSDGGDLLSNSTISPLSTLTSVAGGPTMAAPVSLTSVTSNGTTVRREKSSSGGGGEPIVVDSSPSSSKGTASSSSGRDSAMVVVDSRNVSMQGDEDYVQTILGFNGAANNKSVEKTEEKADISQNKIVTEAQKDSHKSKDSTPNKHNEEDANERRLKSLLSSLRINMVTNARFPQSKLRIKPRKKLQKMKQKAQAKASPVPPKTPTLRAATPHPVAAPPPASAQQKQKTPLKVSPAPKTLTLSKEKQQQQQKQNQQQEPEVRRRNSFDLSQLLGRPKSSVKKGQKSPEKAQQQQQRSKKNPTVISPNKLRTLRDKIREERDKEAKKSSSGPSTAKRRKSSLSAAAAAAATEHTTDSGPAGPHHHHHPPTSSSDKTQTISS